MQAFTAQPLLIKDFDGCWTFWTRKRGQLSAFLFIVFRSARVCWHSNAGARLVHRPFARSIGLARVGLGGHMLTKDCLHSLLGVTGLADARALSRVSVCVTGRTGTSRRDGVFVRS